MGADSVVMLLLSWVRLLMHLIHLLVVLDFVAYVVPRVAAKELAML